MAFLISKAVGGFPMLFELYVVLSVVMIYFGIILCFYLLEAPGICPFPLPKHILKMYARDGEMAQKLEY